MSIDKQRVRAVEKLQELGWRWDGAAWVGTITHLSVVAEADCLHGLLMDRAEQLAGATEDSDEARELEAIGNALLAYEAQRWPGGKIPGGHGPLRAGKRAPDHDRLRPTAVPCAEEAGPHGRTPDAGGRAGDRTP